MNRAHVGRAALLACLLWTPATFAAAQAQLLPVHGTLQTPEGTPVNGVVAINFSLYADQLAGTPLFAEARNVVVEDGEFVVYLGEINPLDPALFRAQASVHIGIRVGADPEMTPRIPLGSVPYAAYATNCGDADTVGGLTAAELEEQAAPPSGAVMYFDLPACPEGWSELVAARGRSLVGLPSGGTAGGTVGAPLGNLENRAHTHAVDPAAVSSSAAGGHDHTYGGGAIFTDLAGSHAHPVDPPATASAAAGEHNHQWLTRTSLLIWSYDPDGAMIQALNVPSNIQSGTGGPPVIGIPNPGNHYTDAEAAHTHSTNIASFNSGAGGEHVHPLTLPAGTTSTTAAHAHSVDVPSTASSAATTADTMPYLQLIVCRRD